MPHTPRRAIAVLTAIVGLTTAAGAAAADPPPVPRVTALAAVGITPEAVAAAGFSAAEAVTLAEQLEGQRTALVSLAALRDAAITAGQSLAIAREGLAARPSDAEAAALVTSLTAEHGAAVTAAEALSAEISDAVFGALSAPKVARARAYALASRYKVEAPMRVAPFSDSEWTLLELALRAEQRAARSGRTLDSEHAQVLSAARSRSDVVEAAQGLTLNLDAIRQALSDTP